MKEWARKNSGMRPEELAVALGISLGTLYNWFKSPTLDKVTVLALAQLGCVEEEETVTKAVSKVSVG